MGEHTMAFALPIAMDRRTSSYFDNSPLLQCSFDFEEPPSQVLQSPFLSIGSPKAFAFAAQGQEERSFADRIADFIFASLYPRHQYSHAFLFEHGVFEAHPCYQPLENSLFKALWI